MPDPPSDERSASVRERGHLERAHHEICTALTVLGSNVELARIELRREGDASVRVTIQAHLSEVDLAVERLKRLATQLRAWSVPDAVEESPAEQK